MTCPSVGGEGYSAATRVPGTCLRLSVGMPTLVVGLGFWDVVLCQLKAGLGSPIYLPQTIHNQQKATDFYMLSCT